MVVSLKLATWGWGKHKIKQKKEASKQQCTLHTKTQKLVPFFFVFFTHYFDLEIENKRHKQLNESRKCQCLFQHTVIHCKHLQVANALRTTCYSC